MILKVDGLSFHYPGNPVLNEIQFSADSGELVAVLGTNGTGKTTLLQCINRVLTPEKGVVYVAQKPTNTFSKRQLAQQMSYVEQRRSGMRMSVFDAVLLGRKPYIQWDMTAKDLDVAESAIDQLELTAYVHRYLDEISGGELQKVMIARAIAQEPQIMLMDEPTNHLDLKNQLDVLDTIRRIVKAKKLTAIVALHDLNLALRYADRFIFMKDRGIYAAGGREVVTPETIEAVYAVPVYLQQCAHYTLVVPK